MSTHFTYHNKKIVTALVSVFFPALLVFFSLIGVRELFLPGYFESHDGVIHVMRLTHFDTALRQGQFPPRWLGSWMGGYGSPLVNYNWSLPYYLASGIYVLGFSFEASIKGVLILTFVGSALAMYLFVKNAVGSHLAAFVSAIFYIWAPYRFTDIYIRGAVGEAAAFLFLPLVCWALLRMFRKQSAFSPLAASLWAGLFLTHNLTALIGSAFLIVFCSVYFLTKIRQHKLVFRSLFFTFIFTLMLSAFFLFPSILEVSFIKYKDGYGDIFSHFPTVAQLMYSTWKYEYSHPQSPDHTMSYQIGIIHLLTIMLAPLLLLYLRRKKGSKSNVLLLLAGLVLVLVSGFLSTTLSINIYRSFPFLSKAISFPWRFLTFIPFGVSCIVGVFFGRLRHFWQYGLAVITVAGVIMTYWPMSKIVSYPISYSDFEYRQMTKTNRDFIADVEFSPVSSSYISLLTQKGTAYGKNIIWSENQRITLDSPQVIGPVAYQTQIKAQEAGVVKINQFAFPGWKATLNSQNVPIAQDAYGLMEIAVPKGDAVLRLEFKDTPVRTVGNLISAASVGFLLLFAVKSVISYQEQVAHQ